MLMSMSETVGGAENEVSLRRTVARVMRRLAAQELVRSSDGNISLRLAPGRYLATPSGVYKAALTADDLIVVDENGRLVAGRPGLTPTSEILMHLEAYRQRPDIGAVLHAHPPYATALTIAEIPFPMNFIPEAWLALGEVPTAPYATPGTAELALSIRGLIRQSNSVLLSHHGSLTVGRTLEEALIALERLEHTARTYLLAQAIGQPQPLSGESLAELKRLRQRLVGPVTAI